MSATYILTASLEDYLEAIFNIIAEKQAVKPKDIAKRLKVANSSVTGALRSLAEKELVNYSPHDVITLTPAGRIAARDVVRRHEVLRDFFIRVLAVNAYDADKAACQMEHSIPKEILERLTRFAEFIEGCPRGGSKWIAGFSHNCDYQNNPANCEQCIQVTLDEVKKMRRGGARPAKELLLRDLNQGQKGRVIKIHNHGEIARRIVEMGVVPGVILEVERVAPLGDPIDVKVKGYHLSLRKDEAALISIGLLVNQ